MRAVLIALLSALAACGDGQGPERPNLVLIVLDTTRPDRLSLYGYPRPTSPNLDALASESTVYERAYSTSSWTPPAHASLFTGLYPHQHRVTQAAWHLPVSQVTLAERLWEAGYRTIGLVGNPMVGRAFGWSQGFDDYHETWRDAPGSDALHPALAPFEDFLATPSERPFFAFFNFNEPHSPYEPPAIEREELVADETPESATNDWRRHFTGIHPLGHAELTRISELYDAEIRYADRLVGDVVAALRQAGRLDDTVLIVTSDHGENLGEHGMVDHVFSLYETTVRIPLLVRFPGVFPAGERVDEAVQIVDVYTTLASLAGLEAAGGEGIDLRKADEHTQRSVLLSYAYPRQALRTLGAAGEQHPGLAPYRHGLLAVREGDRKLILRDDGTTLLYDLAADPGEEVDLSDQEPEQRERLRRRIASLRGAAPKDLEARSAPSMEVDAETLEELRALGYAP